MRSVVLCCLVLLSLLACDSPSELRRSLEQRQTDAGVNGETCEALFSTSTLDFGTQRLGCEGRKRFFTISFRNCSSTIKVHKVIIPKSDKVHFRVSEPSRFPLTSNSGMKIKLSVRAKAVIEATHTSELTVMTNQGQWSLPLRLVGKKAETIHARFFQLKRAQQDIVFVVENSPQMGANLQNFYKNMSSYIRWAIRLDTSFHIGILPADLSGQTPNPGCIRKGWIHNNTNEPILTFERMVRLGTGGKGLQQPLEAMKRSLTASCNKGFFRKDAGLLMVFVSSNPDYSPQTTQHYINYFISTKGFRREYLIQASVVAGMSRLGCRSRTGGFAHYTPRLKEVARRLRGVQTELCKPRWSSTLSALSFAGVLYRTQFYLGNRADVETIQVFVNGRKIQRNPSDGWAYEKSNDILHFSKSAIPVPASFIDVYYTALTCQFSE